MSQKRSKREGHRARKRSASVPDDKQGEFPLRSRRMDSHTPPCRFAVIKRSLHPGQVEVFLLRLHHHSQHRLEYLFKVTVEVKVSQEVHL
jgi:hypothetical protein